MTDLPHVVAGQPYTKELHRIVEAYRREHNTTAGEHDGVAMCNTAIDWWNARTAKDEPMGFDSRRVEIVIQAAVSRHNSARDARDDALWDLLLAEVRMVVQDPKYVPIKAEVTQ